jgi:hypothetical protein
MASVPRAHARSARVSRLDLPGSVSDINNYFEQQGWTDGLPIIPPTEDLASAMLEVSPAPAEQVLGQLPPRNGTVTVEKVAINAVIAGCQPAYFPVVLAAVKAVMQPQFNAGAITTTTGGAAPVLVVRGPIARRIGIHSGTAVLGSGHRPGPIGGPVDHLTVHDNNLSVAGDVNIQFEMATAYLQRLIEGHQRLLRGIRGCALMGNDHAVCSRHRDNRPLRSTPCSAR